MRRFRLIAFALCGVALALSGSLFAADDDIRELKLRDWEPRSMLVTKTTIVETPRYPVIDIHNHLGNGKDFLTADRVAKYLAEMNAAGVKMVVNLDGGWDDRLQETLAALDQAHPGRFATFALINFDGLDDDNWSDREAARLEESFKRGARGLKIDKRLGLRYRYKTGALMKVDDPKLDKIWATCGRLKRPVVIHVSDPAAFFTPLDRYNERWHELNANPHWLFFGEQFPRRQDILEQLHRVIERHPETTFVNTHFGNNVEDLAAVGEKLDKYPNMVVDFDARISELGRQPYTARRFFLKYQDRILFGTDTTPRREAFQIYYRFLETDDEYFDCAASHHLQGFWMIYGIFLPDDVLEKIYYRNAERILGLAVVGSEAGKPATEKPTTEDPAAKKPADKVAAPGKLRVRATADFEVTGDGRHKAWSKTDWQTLARRKRDGLPYEARIKLLYSPTGLYVLFDATDKTLTATYQADFRNLWEEDVFEVFLWTDESHPTYFEYEISPLGFELPIMVTNRDQKLFRWQPWSNVDEKGSQSRVVRKATAVKGGAKKSGAAIAGWSAELFIPYTLLEPLDNIPPKPGVQWRANFYRVDHDAKNKTSWSWVPVGNSFHEYQKFGKLVFE